MNWSKIDFDQFITKNFKPQKNQQTLARLRQCQKRIEQLKINHCIERLFAYEEPQTVIKGNRSTVLSDYEYDRNLPQEITAAPGALRNGLPDNWQDIAKENGWDWAYFGSHVGSGRDHRLVFIIPGKEVEQRVLFVNETNRPADSHVLQVQTIEHVRDGKKLKRPLVHFRAWRRDQHNSFKLDLEEGGRCIECHPNGPRAVVPLPNNKPLFSGNLTLSEFNKRVIINSIPDWSHLYNQHNFPWQELLGKESGCIDCHNNKYRSSLIHTVDHTNLFVAKYPKDYHPDAIKADANHIFFGAIAQKVLLEKSMPPKEYDHYFKNEQERMNFLLNLEKEFQEIRFRWATQIKCQS